MSLSSTSALVLPRDALLSFQPVSGYAGAPGPLGVALVESGSPLANGPAAVVVDVSAMMQDPTGPVSHDTIALDTTILSTRPKGLPTLSDTMQSGGASAMALAPTSISSTFTPSFERSLSASHQTWVHGSSVYHFVSTNVESNTDVPMGAFVTPDGTESQLELVASQADGSPLPNWLAFNSVDRVFSGTPPNDAFGSLDLKVVGHDMFGHEAEVDLHVVLGHKQDLTDLIDVTETPRVIHENMENLQHSTSTLLLTPLPDTIAQDSPAQPTRIIGKSALRSQLRDVGVLAHSRAARGLLDRKAF